jgi:DNA invertase Pin-like site-specific DNA recombinase
MTLRVGIYLRQSQDREDTKLAITRQREDLTKLLANFNEPCEIVAEYCDNDRSAAPGKRRDDYERMLADMAADKLDLLAAWHQDRLNRDVSEMLRFNATALMHDVRLVTMSGEIDLGSDDGEFMAIIGAAVSRKEMRRKSERQKRAARQRAEQGRQWWSSRPFGFAYDDGKPALDTDGRPVLTNGKPKWAEPPRPVLDADGKPTHHPAEAALIRAAYTAVQAGVSVYAITADWNARDVRTPKGNRWRPSQTRQLLLCARNAGLRTFPTEVIDADGRKTTVDEVIGAGKWPAIVSEEVWRAVAAKLGDPDRRCGTSRARKYLLSNLARCGNCGAPMGSGVTKRPRQTPIYTCKSCNKVSRNAAALDAMVIEAVVARLSRDDATDLIVDTARPDLDALTDQRKALRDQQKALGVKLSHGKVSLAMAEAADRGYTEQIEALTKQITAPDRAEIFGDVIGPDADRKFDNLNLDRKRTVIDTLLAITVRPAGRGRRFDPASIDIAYR